MHTYFRSHNKDGGQANQSAVAENAMLNANFIAVCVIMATKFSHCGDPELLLNAVLCYGNMHCQPVLLL